MTLNTLNLFFSYYFEDRHDYDNIITMFRNRGYFNYNNYSMTDKSEGKNEDYVKGLIRPRIDKSSVIVVLIGPGTYTRKWVNWEIEYAVKKGKRIVGVYCFGHITAKLPRKLRELYDSNYYNLEIVNWNSNSIVSAIRG